VVKFHPALLSAKDYLYVLLPPVFWGLSFVAIKVGLESFSPLTLVAIRFLIAGIPLVLFYKRPPVPLARLFAYSFSIGVLQYGLMFLAIHYKLPAGLSSVLIQFQVYITIFLAWVFYRERVTLFQVVGFLLSAVGLIVIGYEYMLGAEFFAFGLILLSALFWSFGNTLLKSFRIADFAGFIAWTSFISAIPLVALALAVDGPRSIVAQITQASLRSWLSLLFMAYLATHLSFTLFSTVMLKFPASRVMPFATLVPVYGLASNAFFMNERLSTYQLVGSGLVFLGLMVTVLLSRYWQNRSLRRR
jgi:O-acetylserine/cysteine efflux transporter